MAASPEAVAATVTRTIVMVETTAQAEEVIAGERGVIQSAQAGHIAVCMSTIDPFAARRLGDRLGARGVAMLDAPVSGGTGRAASGELSVIAGGAPRRSRPAATSSRRWAPRSFTWAGSARDWR